MSDEDFQRYAVDKWGSRWGIFDQTFLNPEPIKLHRDHIDAVADAARRNAKKKTPR